VEWLLRQKLVKSKKEEEEEIKRNKQNLKLNIKYWQKNGDEETARLKRGRRNKNKNAFENG
jgi:hypothetical protein